MRHRKERLIVTTNLAMANPATTSLIDLYHSRPLTTLLYTMVSNSVLPGRLYKLRFVSV